MNGQVENRICPACAVEIRDGAVFCFNCGKSFEAAPTSEAPSVKPKAKIRERKATSASVSADIVSAGIEDSEAAEVDDALEEMREEKVRVRPVSEGARRPQRFSRRQVETQWVAPAEGPGAAFVIGAAVLAVISILIFLIALYLK